MRTQIVEKLNTQKEGFSLGIEEIEYILQHWVAMQLNLTPDKVDADLYSTPMEYIQADISIMVKEGVQ